MRTTTIIILVVLVLISLFYLGYDQPKEGFVTSDQTTFLNQVNNLSALLQKNSNPTGATETELEKQIKILNERLMALIALNNLNTGSGSTIQDDGSLPEINAINDAQLQQLKQDTTINELKRRLANLQKVYASYLQKQSETTVKYDKIPVYSSCIVSEADGRYTLPTTSA